MNFRRNLTIVMTQLFCGLLLLCSGAWAQETLINFDDVPAGTVINTRYPGVTFSRASSLYGSNSGDVFATSSSSARSSPNVVSCNPDEPALTNFCGVTATFSVPQWTVSIDVSPFVYISNGANGSTTTDRPYMIVYGAGFAHEVRYAGPLPNSGHGPVERLTFTSSSANIIQVKFSSSYPHDDIWVWGLFDNLRFSPIPPPCESCEVPGNRLTLSGPAPIFFNNELRLFIRGTDNRIYENVLTQGGVWTGWWEVPGNRLTLSGPAATVLGNQLRLFIRGTDDRIYENVLTQGAGWSGWWEVPGDGLTLSGPAATVIGNELRLYVRGTNDRIYENVLTPGVAWGGWWEVPDYGKLTLSGPAATVLGNKLYLFVRGAYDRIYQNVLTPGVSWTGWSEVPGNGLTPSGPAATVHDDRLHLLIRGYDDRIYQNVLAPGLGTTWWWEVPDSPLTPSEPRAISYGGAIRIFVRDNGGRILMHSYF